MIHQSSFIASGAQIGKNVQVGPFCVIGKNVIIGDNTILHSHVVIEGRTSIGKNCEIFPFASIGHKPQDLKYEGEESVVEIGDNNSIREYVTIQPGTKSGRMKTSVGNNCLLMLGTHIAHDCEVGNNVIFANLATLAGHVTIGDNVVMGGLSAVHQFVRIGQHAMIGGCCGVERDVAPFATVSSERAGISGMNLLGLKRRGFNQDAILDLQKAFNIIFFEDKKLDDAIKEAREKHSSNKLAMELINFISKESKRSLTMKNKRYSED
ncbi:MAG: acyl-ACP--UDP-N-acetylglucosamine O-acyltransferase [Rickettsiaceae bacterium]|nr:acyl-ACP--UDP-N-acetylglucosamine O-acyltransferase [Rickettsiaceae bacterium]